jgi:hypothetical protein
MLYKLSRGLKELEAAEKISAKCPKSIRKAALAEAACAVEQTVRSNGLSAETVEKIKKQIWGYEMNRRVERCACLCPNNTAPDDPIGLAYQEAPNLKRLGANWCAVFWTNKVALWRCQRVWEKPIGHFGSVNPVACTV